MSGLDELMQRVEHLLVRHAELQRTQTLLQQQAADLTAERDELRRRLTAARQRLDALIERIPPTAAPASSGAEAREASGADE